MHARPSASNDTSRAPVRNFFERAFLSVGEAGSRPINEFRFALRSLSGPCGQTEIPRRFSSSSLPPSFVSGRFAGFCIPTSLAGNR